VYFSKFLSFHSGFVECDEVGRSKLELV